MIDMNRRIYSSGDGIVVYCDKEKETITVNRSEMGIAESYFTYLLKEKEKGMWLWGKKEHTRTQFSDGDCVNDFGTIGFIEKEQAKDFLINKVVRDWKMSGPYSFKVNSAKLEAALRKAFL